MVPLSITLIDPWAGFQGRDILQTVENKEFNKLITCQRALAICWRRAVAVRVRPTCVWYNELFVIAHVDDILNTDSNKYYSIAVIYNFYKYGTQEGKTNHSCGLMQRARFVCSLGSNPAKYTFLFFFYYIILLGTQTDRPVAWDCQHQLSFL